MASQAVDEAGLFVGTSSGGGVMITSATWLMPAAPQPRLLKIWQAEVVPAAGAPGQILAADKSGIVIACGQNALRVSILQLEGGRRLTAPEFLAGHSLAPGQTLP